MQQAQHASPQDPPVAKSRIRRGLAILLAVVLLVAGGGTTAAWSFWSQSVTLAPSLTAGTVVAPASLTCTTRGNVILGPIRAELTWPVVADTASYAVMVRNADGSMTEEVARTTSPDYVVTAGLLNGLVGSLLALLLGGTTVYVYIETIHVSGWRSPAGPAKGIKSSGLLSGLLGGIACA